MSVTTTLEPSARRAFAFSRASATARETVAIELRDLLADPGPGELVELVESHRPEDPLLEEPHHEPLEPALAVVVLGAGASRRGIVQRAGPRLLPSGKPSVRR